jgi:hypothetical protein
MAASLFEEFSRSSTGKAKQSSGTETAMGRILRDSDASSGIFDVRRLDWHASSFQSRGALVKMASSNNILLAATTTGSLLRWNLDSSAAEEEIEISRKPEDAIEHVFLDPSGHHAVICTKNADNYYLHSRSTRPKKLSRLPGGAIESIAFDRFVGTESATRSFLVGTKMGYIYEMAVDSGGKERVCQPLFQLDKSLPITSIHFESTASPTADPNDARYFVLLVTSLPTRLYNFFGGPTLQALFADYSSQDGVASFTELPGDLRRAELTCYSKLPQTRAQMFALMSKEGIYHGKLLANFKRTDSLILEAQLIPYAACSDKTPVSISATEYHFITLMSDRVQFTSRLNGSLVQEEVLPSSDGNPLGLVRDVTKSTTWLYTDSAVFQIITLGEDSAIWKIFLEKAVGGDEKQFATAYEHCKKKEEQLEVLRAQADFYLSKGQADKAALYFARSGAPFEEVILRLLKSTSTKRVVGDTSPPYLAVTDSPELNSLRIYLQEELKVLPQNSKSHRTMLCTWLCEIFLHQIASTSYAGSNGGNGDVLEHFKDFIRSNRAVLDQGTTLNLMTSRGQGQHRALLLFYAQMVGDYDRVVAHYISEERYSDAINLLLEAPFDQVESLIYKCAPVLIEFEPESTVQLLISKQQLRVQGLLPALLRYETLLDALNEKTDPQAIKTGNNTAQRIDRDFQGNEVNFAILFLQNYLQSAVANDVAPEAIVYHTLSWLLAKYDDVAETRLTAFMQQVYEKKQVGLQVSGLNPEFILRQCKRYNRQRAIVYVFLLLGMESEAVGAALHVDIEVAKNIARSPMDDSVKKEFWIMIAKHVILHDSNAIRALGLLSESGDALKIEDLLPLLPDFTEIEFFKEEICRTLEDCGAHIDHLKLEMEELSESAENISLELDSMKKRGYSASSNQRCEYCLEGIFSKQFYLFPCSHGFHCDCLLRHAMTHNHLDSSQLSTVKSLEEQLRFVSARAKDNDKRALVQQELLQNELDGFIAADCPLCGYVMIASLSQPLITAEDESDLASWKL